MGVTIMYAELLAAVCEMADALGGIDTGEVYSNMSCVEIEAVAGVLRAAGCDLEADFIIKEHSLADEEGDEHFEWAPA